MQPPETPAFVAFGIQPILNPTGALLVIQDTMTPIFGRDQANPPNETIQVPTRPVAIIKLSLEHLKLAVIILHDQMKKYEIEHGDIHISKKVIADRKINLEKDW